MPVKQRRETDVLLWTVPEHTVAVECSWALLEEMHGAVQDGFRRLSRGGVEVGGVLFGRHTESLVRVLAWRPILCDHTRGPAFLLSNKDHSNLTRLLESADQDPQLQVLEPVGWFVSHTRSGVALTDDDAELFGRYFSNAWNVALVISPEKTGPSRAGFFLREPDGRIRRDESYREFTIDNVREPAPRPEAASPASDDPFFAPEPVSRRSRWTGAAVAVVLCGLGLSALPYFRQGDTPALSQQLALRVLDNRGQLKIEWDPKSAPVQECENAILQITDSGTLRPVELDRETAQRGSVTYARLSDDVTVRLVVNRKDQAPVQELARYVGPPVPKQESQEVQRTRENRDRIVEQTRELREQLSEQSKRARVLEGDLKRLTTQFEREKRKSR